MKRLWLILLLIPCLLLASCENIIDSTVIVKEYYLPEILLSGDVNAKVTVNLNNIPIKTINGAASYSLNDVIAKAETTAEITHIMILTRSSKAVYINIESAEYYYFRVNSNGIVRVDCTLLLHQKTGNLPVIGVQELVLCAEGKTSAGIQTVSASGEISTISYSALLTAYGVYNRITNAVSDNIYTIATFNKQTTQATKLLLGHASAKITLESGETVIIKPDSLYSMHWANGSLYLVEFITPVTKIEYLTA